MTRSNWGVAVLVMAVCAATGARPAIANDLTACEEDRLGPRAECGSFIVPEDRTRTDGRTIELSVVVLRAEEPAGREPVFMLAGGPGGAAADLVELALGPFAEVGKIRDFVFVDQRGTGESNPLHCHTDSAENPQTAFGQLFDPELMGECLEELSKRADVTLYTTLDAVADLDEVRARLGYDKVMLWGGSGGTRTALVWMREHPDRIQAAVIDGVAPTSFRAPSGMARGAQEALETAFADCRAQESCRSAYPDLESEFQEVLALFDDGPVATAVTRDDGTEVPVKMYRGDFGYALRGMLYRAGRIASLPKLIHEAAASADVSAFAQALWIRDVRLRPSVSMGVHMAVYCAEDLPFIDSELAAELNAGTFLGDYLMEQYRGVCDIWRAQAVPAEYLEPTKADIPTLIYSGYYDPSTPVSLGEEVASHLPNSRHIVVRNEAHGSEFGCGRQAAIDFLLRGTLEGLGPACEEAGPIEFETP